MTPLSGAWSEGSPTLKTNKPLELSIGAASPLWFLFAGAAATGAAYWWMSQWVKPVNLEAIMGAAKAVPAPLAEPTIELLGAGSEEPVALQALAEPAFAAPVAPVEAVAEAVTEAVAEVQAQTVEIAETVADTTADALDTTAEAAQSAISDTSETIEAAAKAITPPKAKPKLRPPITEG